MASTRKQVWDIPHPTLACGHPETQGGVGLLASQTQGPTRDPGCRCRREVHSERQVHRRQALYGTAVEEVRWQECVGYVNNNMESAVGSLYVKKAFSKDSKNMVGPASCHAGRPWAGRPSPALCTPKPGPRISAQGHPEGTCLSQWPQREAKGNLATQCF